MDNPNFSIANLCNSLRNKVNLTKKKQKLTVFVHAHLQAFFQSTRLTLIAVCFIYDASASARLTPANRKIRRRMMISGEFGRSITAIYNFTFAIELLVRDRNASINRDLHFYWTHELAPPPSTSSCPDGSQQRKEKKFVGICPKHQHEINHIFDWLNWHREESGGHR